MAMTELTPCLLFLSLALSAILCHLAATQRRRSGHRARLPPGPTPLPLIGSLLALGSQPHRSLARLARAHGPVMSLELGTVTTVVVSSPASAREALQLNDKPLSARSVPDAVRTLGHADLSIVWIDSSNPSWKSLRAFVKSHLFAPHSLVAGEPLRRTKCKELVAHVRGLAGRTVDVGKVAFATSLNLMSNTFFSVDVVGELGSESAQEFRDLVWAVMEEVGRPNLSDFFPVLRLVDPQGHRRAVTRHLNKLFQMFDKMIDNRLDEHNGATSRGDFLDQLLRSNLDRATVKSLLADMFIAGSDTSSNTVEWAMAELLRNPGSMARARAELAEVVGRGNEVEESDIGRLPYLQAVVKETFRLHPPGPLLMPHRAEAGVELGGYAVPKGSRVLVNVWAIGRDGEVWADPESFSPERFLGSEVEARGRHFELLPFGSGRRMCPGLPLGHRMVHLMLASLLHWFDWGLPDGMRPGDVDLSEKFGVTLALAVPTPAIALPVKC